MCLGKMLDKQKNRGTLQPYLRNVNVRWFSFDLSDLKEMRFEEGERGRYELRPGDLVICEGGEPGRAAVWNRQTERAKIQKALHRVRFHPDEYDPYFAMYFLYFGTITHRFAPYYTGTTIKHLTGAALSQIHFPIPSLNEQRRIVAAIEANLTRLDSGVVNLERAKARLRRYRAAVLKAACEGRLVPTEAELARAEGRDYEPADRLLVRILRERRSRWEADELAKMTAQGKTPKGEAWRSKYQEPASPHVHASADLPEGWTWATVEQVSAAVQYGTSAKSKESREGIPVLRMGNIVDGHLSLDALKYLPADHEEFPALLLDSGDVLFNRTNSAELVGKTAVYRGGPSPCSFASYLIRVRLIDGYAPDLLAYFLNSSMGRAWVASVVTQQVGQANVNGSKLQALVIPIPPAAEQARIVAEVERRLSLIDELEATVTANLKRADRLRQAILRRAFEGKLVPQDPTDEPASALLERMRWDRQRQQRLAFDS
jgi:type I restriction enzyme S subunit